MLIEYIKSSIQILVQLKAEETIQQLERQRAEARGAEYEDSNEYEKLLRKLESDIRTYIKIEHQMKLHSENLQLRIDELEKEKNLFKQKNKQLTEVI